MGLDPKGQLQRGMEQMNLPSQVMGASLVEITGGRQILLSGQKGIRVYSSSEIIVDLPDCAVRLRGEYLGIVTMTAHELLIRGYLRELEYIR